MGFPNELDIFGPSTTFSGDVARESRTSSQGKGQITLGRSLLELLGAIIDVGKGTMHLSSPSNNHIFPRLRIKIREVRARNLVLMLLHLRTLDSFLLLMPNLKALKKSTCWEITQEFP